MRNPKEYNKKELEGIVKKCLSLREVGRRLGVSNQAAKSAIVRYNVDFSHFKHGKAYDDMIDKKYHMLTVGGFYKVGRRIFAKCVCECGKKKNIRADDLKSGRAVSCGCHSKNRWNMVGDKNPAWKGRGELSSTKYLEMKRQALKRKKEFNVSIEYLWDLYKKQDRKCALSGLPVIFGRNGYRNETTASLDRIDNDKGYIEGNVRWVLKDINMIRRDYNSEYFVKLCCAIASFSRQSKKIAIR
jgi:hypothetical protein